MATACAPIRESATIRVSGPSACRHRIQCTHASYAIVVSIGDVAALIARSAPSNAVRLPQSAPTLRKRCRRRKRRHGCSRPAGTPRLLVARRARVRLVQQGIRVGGLDNSPRISSMHSSTSQLAGQQPGDMIHRMFGGRRLVDQRPLFGRHHFSVAIQPITVPQRLRNRIRLPL